MIPINRSSRRQFLKSSALAACSAGWATSVFLQQLAHGVVLTPPAMSTMRKGLLLDMVPKDFVYAERFRLVRDAGFEVVQAPTTPDERVAEEMKRAADDALVRIDSVMNLNHSKYPLSSSDPTVVNSFTGQFG